MRIHTDKVTFGNIHDAARKAGAEVAVLSDHGSRKRDHAFEVRISGNGVQGGGFGTANFKTATWDEWGIFLAALFEIDPDMIAGPYKGASDDEYEGFHFLTDSRYEDLTPAEQHKRHRWQWAGTHLTYGFIPGMASRYSEAECSCGAVRRFVTDYVKAVKASA